MFYDVTNAKIIGNVTDINKTDNATTRSNKISGTYSTDTAKNTSAINQLKNIDNAAFNGKDIYILNPDSKIEYTINVSASGKYEIKLHTFSPGDKTDSVIISLTGPNSINLGDTIFDLDTSTSAIKDKVWNQPMQLNNGLYKLTIKYREPTGIHGITIIKKP